MINFTNKKHGTKPVKGGVVFVLFGATGDLVRRKLIPAIYDLYSEKKINKFKIIGVARKSFTPEKLIENSQKYIPKYDKKILRDIEKNTSYIRMDFSDSEKYHLLEQELNILNKNGYGLKLFHLSTMSENFEVISENLKKINVIDKNSRVLYEKPFGNNLKSSLKINKKIIKTFGESNIYRVDHFLGKELVEGIVFTRFSNEIFEPLWNNKHVKSMQFLLDEDINLKNKGAFFEKYGVVKDVVQNHLLQLVALVGMEKPKLISGKYIQKEKEKLLKKIKIKDSIFAQYSGYRTEKNINKKSRVETFAALKLEINNKRWKGVPIYIKTGKNLSKKNTKIIIEFKKPQCLLIKGGEVESNYLEIRIWPNPGMSIYLNEKTPGSNNIEPIKLDFCYDCAFGSNTSKGYKDVYLKAIQGDHSLSISFSEIKNSWKIIENLDRDKLYFYNPGSEGPKELFKFNKKHSLKT